MITVKKLIILLFTIVLMFLLTACKPANKREVMRYAKDEYGEAEFIKEEVVNENEIIYYLKDKEYGFEYYITSYVTDITIDGAKFGEAENKSSDFNNTYYSYITNKLHEDLKKLEDTYQVEIIVDNHDYNIPDYDIYALAEIHYKDSSVQTAPAVSKEVKDLFTVYDTRNYWKDNSIDVYDKNEERIGRYDLKYDMFMTPEQEEDYFYIEKAEMLNKNAVYVRKEEKLFKETGLSLDDVANVLGNDPVKENTMVTYYYFTVDDKEFFLADVLVNPNCRWYSNYDEVIGEN